MSSPMSSPVQSSFGPNIRLFGSVGTDVLESFLHQMEQTVHREGPIVLELTTTGGDAEIARRIGLEIRQIREYRNRETLFIGKTAVYSAGVVIMSSFQPSARYLTRDTRLLIHERRLDSDIRVSGPLTACIQRARELISDLENGLAIEREGFAELAAGSKMTTDQIIERAKYNWYVTAQEALDLGLINGLL